MTPTGYVNADGAKSEMTTPSGKQVLEADTSVGDLAAAADGKPAGTMAFSVGHPGSGASPQPLRVPVAAG